MKLLEGSSNDHVEVNVYNVEGDVRQQCLHYLPEDARGFFELLQPITDASHTRDRKRSPPDSACIPGTRRAVINWIIAWVSSRMLIDRRHVLWMYGYAGCGKSAIAQEVSEQVQGGGRLLATFFFCRNAGDRSKIGRLPNTLASQMGACIPDTIPFIQAAVKAEPGLLQVESSLSLSARLQRLVFEPFEATTRGGVFSKSFLTTPYLIIIDGLDECDDKEGVQEFISTALKFFRKHRSIPLRMLITSRVEQHIHSSLVSEGGVILKDLANHCSRDDITEFMRVVFDAQSRSNPLIQAYVRENGPWPSRTDREELVDHIGGSFIFASTLFKFIFLGSGSPDDCSTPFDRFQLALNIDPGLDGLYLSTLSRAEHLPHFSTVISTITLLEKPLPISGIAELLDIRAHEVVHVLIDMQAIIQVPGTDDAPVTFYHTSLRDFLTNESRSGRFFAPPSFHMRLCALCADCELRAQRQNPKSVMRRRRQTAAVSYSQDHGASTHWNLGREIGSESDLRKVAQLRRNILSVLPDSGRAQGLRLLGIALVASGSPMEDAISAHRQALDLQPHPNPNRHISLHCLGWVLESQFTRTKSLPYLEESIVMHRECLTLRPRPHPERNQALCHLGHSLLSLFERTKSLPYLEESISMHREALELRPPPHIDRDRSLYHLGRALVALFGHSKSLPHLEEGISMHREALRLRPHPHPRRLQSLADLGSALTSLFVSSNSHPYLEEAISYHREALDLQPFPHSNRHQALVTLGQELLFLARHPHSHSPNALEDSISMFREALDLQVHPHPKRHQILHYLGVALETLFARSHSVDCLVEAIAMFREAVKLLPDSHSERGLSLYHLAFALQSLFNKTGSLCHLEEAVSIQREVLDLRPHPHPQRHKSLNHLGCALDLLFSRSKTVSHLEEAVLRQREALDLWPSPHPERHLIQISLGEALRRCYKETGKVEYLDEAVRLLQASLTYFPPEDTSNVRANALSFLGLCFLDRCNRNPSFGHLDEALECFRAVDNEGTTLMLRKLFSELQAKRDVKGTPAGQDGAGGVVGTAGELEHEVEARASLDRIDRDRFISHPSSQDV